MKTPDKMGPQSVYQSYIYIAAIMSDETLALAECEADMALQEAKYIQEERTSAASKALVRASEAGQKAFILKAMVNASEEILRALKKAQGYHENTARNLY